VDYKRQQCSFCKKNLRAENFNKHISVCSKNPINIKPCKNCNKPVKSVYEIFCSLNCSASYNNAHKLHGTRRSKIEAWLEQQLKLKYPNMAFQFNKKDAIGSELDIFIPNLNIAFEINGVYHYKPIHGPSLLKKIQNNDTIKIDSCKKKGIILYTIDISDLTMFSESAAIPYLETIRLKIDNHI
jgi:hypothetical protein